MRLCQTATFCLTLLGVAVQADGPLEYRDGGLIRGPADKKEIALEFTADEFVEGGPVILDQLARHRITASFFLTGRCLRDSANSALVKRIVAGGHYLGPHSDSHPLLCSWETPPKTLVTREFFLADMKRNLDAIENFGVPRASIRCFVPPYEWYNGDIVKWSRELGLAVVDFTSGTRSTADYTESGSTNYVSSQAILESIERQEQKTGANGWLLLMHLGAGPRRADKMHERLGELLDYFQGRGYQFVRVDRWQEQHAAP